MMKIRNLMDYPIQLGDGKMIGAAGTTEDERNYELDKLTAQDQRLVKMEMLETVKLETVKEDDVPTPAASQSKTGGTTNAK